MNPFTTLGGHALLLMFLWAPFVIAAAFTDRERAPRRVREPRRLDRPVEVPVPRSIPAPAY